MSLRGKLLRGGALAMFALLLSACGGEYPQSVFRPVTDFARDLNDLFMMIFWWTLGILIIVEALILYIVFRFRRRSEDERPTPVHGNTTLEIVWTVIPAIILVIITVPTVKQIFASYRPPTEDALIIEAIGHQWWWEFRYPESEIVTANELHIPVGRPVHIRLTSADVLHNFWFPRLAGKRYNYPIPAKAEGDLGSGHEKFNILTFNVEEPGTYLGQCAEYCGTSHAIMRMRAIAYPQAEYEAWVASMKAPGATAAAGITAGPSDTTAAGAPQPLVPGVPAPSPGPEAEAAAPLPVPAAATDPRVAEGKRLFESRACIACHAVAGTNARGVIGPNLTRLGSRWSIGAGAVPMTHENLVRWIKSPQSVKPGTLMPGTKEEAAGMPPTGLSDQEVDAIAAYLLSLK